MDDEAPDQFGCFGICLFVHVVPVGAGVAQSRAAAHGFELCAAAVQRFDLFIMPAGIVERRADAAIVLMANDEDRKIYRF